MEGLSSAWQTEGLRGDIRAYERSPGSTSEGFFRIANAIIHAHEGDPQLLDAMIEGFVGGPPAAVGAVSIEGPTVGAETRWFASQRLVDGVLAVIYLVAFRNDDDFVVLITAGIPGPTLRDDTLVLATLVVERLAGL